MRERAQQRLLHQIVGAVDIAAQRYRERAQTRHRGENLVAYGWIEFHAAPSSCSLKPTDEVGDVRRVRPG